MIFNNTLIQIITEKIRITKHKQEIEYVIFEFQDTKKDYQLCEDHLTNNHQSLRNSLSYFEFLRE